MNDEKQHFKQVLSAEIARIVELRNDATRVDTQQDVIQQAHQANLSGLALSGGGIRSATFNLGILQALAEAKLLGKFDYLSTVSGGGYIGSWLSAWIYRKKNISEIETQLTQAMPSHQGGNPVSFLRKYSNFLTTQAGLFSLDTLAAISVLARNLVLNQTILICMLLAVLLVPHLLTMLCLFYPPTALLPLLFITFAVFILAYGLESIKSKHRSLSQTRIACTILLPAFAAALSAASCFSHWPAQLGSKVKWMAYGALGYSAIWLIAFGVNRFIHYKNATNQQTKVRCASSKFLIAALATLITGGFIGLLFYAYAHIFSAAQATPLLDRKHALWLSLSIGTSVLMLFITLAGCLHIGIGKRWFSELAREWLGRIGGMFIAASLAWTALCLISFYSAALFKYLDQLLVLSGGLVFTAYSAVSLWLANSNKSGGKHSKTWVEMLVKMLPYILILGLAIALSAGVYKLLGTSVPLEQTEPHTENLTLKGNINLSIDTPSAAHYKFDGQISGATASFRQAADTVSDHYQVIYQYIGSPIYSVFGVLLAIALFLSFRVDVNIFSMHQFYRNRLTRCYLGASNSNRDAEPFTDFDPNDDLPLSALAQQRPYHLINTTLNLTQISQENTQWQQRLGASFTFSPLYTGFAFSKLDEHAFRASKHYMTKESLHNSNPEGVQLGVAMAISGAAANPNQGYHSSPALAFLMTFFNIRLGRWCGNPAHKSSWQWSSPGLGSKYLLQELLGNTNEKTGFVNLSDGGHFENLGIYELVRRRCRYIVVCDAGEDGEYNFEDLGNAIHKCYVDFGIEIDINTHPIIPAENGGHSLYHCAVGTIHYYKVDQQGSKGMLLLIKPSLTGKEPTDIYHYARAHTDFPQQSTADQWFDENQFECYRKLGQYIGRVILANAPLDDWEKTFSFLQQQWSAPARPK